MDRSPGSLLASYHRTLPPAADEYRNSWTVDVTCPFSQDTTHRRLSNRLVLAGALGALGLALAPGGLGLASALQGGAIALLVFLPGWVLHQLGAGDVKLAAVCGLLVGADAVWGLCLAILLAGGLQALLWSGGRWLQRQGLDGGLGPGSARPPMHLPPPRRSRPGSAAQAAMTQPPAARSGRPQAAARMPYAWAVAAGSALHLLGWP